MRETRGGIHDGKSRVAIFQADKNPEEKETREGEGEFFSMNRRKTT